MKGELLDQVVYDSSWQNQEPKVREALERHNGGYSSYGRVRSLYTLDEFEDAMIGADDKIVAVCYNNGNREAEAGWDTMKP